MNSKKRQWRNLIIDRAFQFKLMAYFVLLFLLTTASLYTTIFFFFYRVSQKALGVGIPPNHIFFRFMHEQEMQLTIWFGSLALLYFFLLIGVGFLVSHRIAGPLQKLKNHLMQIQSVSEPFLLRKNDFFKDLEPIVDSLRDRLK